MNPSGPIDPDTWARANDLFHRALDRFPEQRAAFLDEVCAGDPVLRAEVGSLLASHERTAGFIETQAAVAAWGTLSSHTSAIPETIGPYRIVRVLGQGGMGVVYLAEDTRLGRTVALKSLAPRFVGDQTRRERLRREARAAAALNHPGIATVYALEEFDDHLYIAGEYVPGETLRGEVSRGPLGPARALDTVLAIARALAVAHEHGIVHRDLKPENVIRTPRGDLKILDFGLARIRDLPQSAMDLSGDGTILGTPAYMSPEQIRGEQVDARSDVFALGLMFYELVTGVHPFAGSDPASTIARILEAEPARLIDRLPPDMPSSSIGDLELVMRNCLRKRREERFLTAQHLVDALVHSHVSSQIDAPNVHWAARIPVSTERDAKALWWWEFHQIVAATAYILLLIPLWRVRDMTAGSKGTLLFLAGLVGAVVASTLRLHLRFAVRLSPSAGLEERLRSARWILLADVLLVAVLLAEGLLAHSVEETWAVLLVAAAASTLVSFAIIEPATARAAFGKDKT